ncbi:TPA: hypothetical protein DDZ86_02640 [Candidatus Dependentiae bacterium]|nr:MAG: hypothetical protein UW09_C0001G0121 [candidate division TM6 bacterium GW2011_GWF2_43_87]HBL98516.1 hypothetical protein [Candidatus Dependentiae bacterium]
MFTPSIIQRFFVLSLLGASATCAADSVCEWQLCKDTMDPNIGQWTFLYDSVETRLPKLLNGELDIQSTLTALNTDEISNLRKRLIEEKQLWTSGKEGTGAIPLKDSPSAALIKAGMIASALTGYVSLLSSIIIGQYGMATQTLGGMLVEADADKTLSKEFIAQLKQSFVVMTNKCNSYKWKCLGVSGAALLACGLFVKWNEVKKNATIEAVCSKIDELVLAIDAFKSTKETPS